MPMNNLIENKINPLINKPVLYLLMFAGIFFSACSEHHSKAFSFEYGQGDLTILHQNKPVLVYNIDEDLPAGVPEYYARSGYLHPLFSPSGKSLTDGFPMGHSHQHGAFFAFVNTTFQDSTIDFWNQHKLTGTVRHTSMLDTFYVEDKIGFTSTLEHIGLKHGKVLDETWKIEVFEREGNPIIDFTSFISNPGKDTLFINPYKYGGFAIRGAAQWNEEDSVFYQNHAQFLTKEGNTLENANHAEAEWATLYGNIDNQAAGITVISHPDNFRYPQKIRVHPEMPYFCYAPMVDKGFYLAPKGEYISRYRIFTFDGMPDTLLANRLLKEFSLIIN
jgi:hypothetical protein